MSTSVQDCASNCFKNCLNIFQNQCFKKSTITTITLLALALIGFGILGFFGVFPMQAIVSYTLAGIGSTIIVTEIIGFTASQIYQRKNSVSSTQSTNSNESKEYLSFDISETRKYQEAKDILDKIALNPQYENFADLDQAIIEGLNPGYDSMYKKTDQPFIIRKSNSEEGLYEATFDPTYTGPEKFKLVFKLEKDSSDNAVYKVGFDKSYTSLSQLLDVELKNPKGILAGRFMLLTNIPQSSIQYQIIYTCTHLTMI